jgi:23S rRNA U2552 (ribose-2'-O)-methylase RlmE/FtsJ
MIHFLVPRNSSTLYESIECTTSSAENTITEPIISSSLAFYLSDIKQQIVRYENDWDTYKRYTNPYEYIHTIVPHKRKAIAKHKPLSRSYFKMIELIHFFRLLDPYCSKRFPPHQQPANRAIKSFHLAEGPGGFIEALVNLRANKEDQYIGMTILDDAADSNIPAWKKSQHFLKENPNVFVETGYDKTGDILSVVNFDCCVAKYESTMDIITGDGGFDFSVDFNQQESQISRLLFAQMAFAIAMQKRGGSFILKVFDCFTRPSLDILAILSSFYEKVYMTKPQTSRYANSEKYIVCKGFLHSDASKYVPNLRRAFVQMMENPNNMVHQFLSVPNSLYFCTRIEEFNAIFGQQQIENIHYTLTLIDNRHNQEKIEHLVKTNSQRSINWCMKHNIPYWTNTVVANLFLDRSV